MNIVEFHVLIWPSSDTVIKCLKYLLWNLDFLNEIRERWTTLKPIINKFKIELKYTGEIINGCQDPTRMAELLSSIPSLMQLRKWKLEIDDEIKAASKFLLFEHICPTVVKVEIYSTQQLADSSSQILSDFMKSVADKPYVGELYLNCRVYHDSLTPMDEIIINLESAP